MKMMNTLCIILSHHILCFTARGSSCSSDTLDDGYLLGGDVLQACLLQDTKSLIDSLLKIQEKYRLIPQELLSRYTTDHAPVSSKTKESLEENICGFAMTFCEIIMNLHDVLQHKQ